MFFLLGLMTWALLAGFEAGTSAALVSAVNAMLTASLLTF